MEAPKNASAAGRAPSTPAGRQRGAVARPGAAHPCRRRRKPTGCRSARWRRAPGSPLRPPIACSSRSKPTAWSSLKRPSSSGRSASPPTAWARPSCAAASSSTARASVMQELMEKSGETANLGVAEDDCVVFVSQVETHQAIRAFFRPGTRSPFHA